MLTLLTSLQSGKSYYQNYRLRFSVRRATDCLYIYPVQILPFARSVIRVTVRLVISAMEALLIFFSYSSAIDMWSLGCIVVELFLGLPLFPGSSEYNQVSRITEMLGLPPVWMLEMGKQSMQFFEKAHDEYGRRQYRLKSMEQYSREHNSKEQPSKKYFQATSLPEIIRSYTLPRKNMKQAEIDRGMRSRCPRQK